MAARKKAEKRKFLMATYSRSFVRADDVRGIIISGAIRVRASARGMSVSKL